MHLSSSTNTEAHVSVGWSGLNFTAGGMRVCDCSGLLCYPKHAYSVAGPSATTERESASCLKLNLTVFTFFFPSTFSFEPFFSHALRIFLHCEDERGDRLVRLELRGRRGPGHRAKRVRKAGLIPLKRYFTCP